MNKYVFFYTLLLINKQIFFLLHTAFNLKLFNNKDLLTLIIYELNKHKQTFNLEEINFESYMY